MKNCSDTAPIEELVASNAEDARALHGVPHLAEPSFAEDAALRMRHNTLWRALYPQSAPAPARVPPKSTASLIGEGAPQQSLMVLPTKKPNHRVGDDGEHKQWSAPSTLAIGKRGRAAAEDPIIRVDPEQLRRQHTLVVSEAAQAEAREQQYVPPPSWKMFRVLVGHQGWVWSAAVDPTNAWFATGGFDSVIKVWDLATGSLKLNLTGHNEAVRSIALSRISPYMFSGSDDHSVKCWDLERNEIIRDFFGHRSAVHCVAAHPSMDVVVSGGRDKTVRVWDIRSRAAIHTMVGHTDSVMSLTTQQANPQVISGGSDGLIYLWDLASGRPQTRLTRHKKPVRGLSFSPTGSTLVSCGADAIRVWKLPTGEFVSKASTAVDQTRLSSHTVEPAYRWSCCAMSSRSVLAVGSQDGQLGFFDWNRPQPHHVDARYYAPYQMTKTKSIPGTLPGEGGINCITFDASGTRAITAESDKSVKMWRMRD